MDSGKIPVSISKIAKNKFIVCQFLWPLIFLDFFFHFQTAIIPKPYIGFPPIFYTMFYGMISRCGDGFHEKRRSGQHPSDPQKTLTEAKSRKIKVARFSTKLTRIHKGTNIRSLANFHDKRRSGRPLF